MATLTTAKTRVGLGGPSINYERPFAAKTESETPEGPPKFEGLRRNVGRMLR